MEPKKCMILNPYSRTLKEALIPQTLENWYAILGSSDVQQFYLETPDCAVIYADDIFNRLTGSMAGTRFKGWEIPVFGILLFVGPPDTEGATSDLSEEAITKIQEQFKTAQVRRFKFSG